MANFHFENLREEDGLPILTALDGYVDTCNEGVNNPRYVPEIRQSLAACVAHARDIRYRLRAPSEQPPTRIESRKEVAELLAQFVLALEERMPTTTREIYETFGRADASAMRAYVTKVRTGL